MSKTFFALLFLCVTIAACDPAVTDTNSNANHAANANVSPAPVSSPSPQTTPAAAPLKAGDKVKVTINGAASDATIVAVDEKAGEATVKVQGDNKEKKVPLADIVRQ
jgi:protein involved in polysaccharide export with SLBB domain